MRAAGWRKSADENIAREQGRRTFEKDSAIGQWVDRLVAALAFPLFLSVDSRVSETCLGRKRSCSLLLVGFFTDSEDLSVLAGTRSVVGTVSRPGSPSPQRLPAGLRLAAHCKGREIRK